MIIEPVCPKLFQVSDILPESVVEEIKNLDWLNLPTDAPPLQEMMIRKRVKDEEVITLTKINQLLEKHGKQIGELFNLKFNHIRTLWWLDLPGFTSGIHIDSTGCPALQAYWIAPGIKYGTHFYSTNSYNPRQSTLIKGFDFIPNTGYLNDLTGDDSEKIYHGMLNPVPENTFRISSYTQFWTE
jgi:hypothetical protein